MNTRFLLTLRAVAQTGSLAGAARQRHLAVASVGEQLRALEAELGAPLVARRGRGVVLTPAGEAVAEAAGAVLHQVEELRRLAHPDEAAGLLRVGSIPSALVAILPRALRLVAARHPRLEVKVVPGTSATLHRRVEAGELDCALTPRPHFALSKNLAWHLVRREALMVVAPDGLAGETPEALLRAAPLIRVDRGVWTGRLVTAFLEDHRLAPRELFELDAHEAVLMLVAEGLGVALLHDTGLRLPEGLAVRRLPIADARYAREVGVIMARRSREGLARLLAGAAADAVG